MKKGSDKNTKPVFLREDCLLGVGAAALAFAIYLTTLAPNVTFLDSGELIVAAQHFGVPHPPGYPLWTLTTWLFQLLPLGNAAWECNLWSALCATAAMGLLGGLLSASGRLYFPSCPRWLRLLVAFTATGTAACSISMWSQAVITEVYSLHVLMAALVVVSLFRWCASGEGMGGLLLPIFLLTLGFGNHYMILALGPVILMAVLLFRRELLAQTTVWLVLIGSYLYGGYAWLSGRGLDIAIANRFMILSLLGAGVFVKFRKERVEWGFPLKAAAVVVLGLLPYLYLPLASQTNPPMNWGYTRDPQGFFFVVDRAQYKPVSHLIRSSLGRALLIDSPKDPVLTEADKGATEMGYKGPPQFPQFVLLLLGKVANSLSPPGVLLFLVGLSGIWRLAPPARKWLGIVTVAFFLSLLVPGLEGARADLDGWALQMPYHGFTFFLAAILMACGTLSLVPHLQSFRSKGVIALAVLSLVPPAWAFQANRHLASQRGKWLGWEMGMRMMRDLPEKSVLLAGTDHGYFISTYLVYGESLQSAHLKRDPSFDRRDVFVLTQNQLLSSFYLKELQDRYGPERPAPSGPLGAWFSRDGFYPADNLALLDFEDVAAMAEDSIRETGVNIDMIEVSSAAAKLLWERNREKHPFFVEQSFSMPWLHPYAVPHGLLLHIMPKPLAQIPMEAVRADTTYWRELMERWEGDRALRSDPDACRMLSNARAHIADLYRFRRMKPEALQAYREALVFYPSNPAATGPLAALLSAAGEDAAARKVIDQALGRDPLHHQLKHLHQLLGTPDGRAELESLYLWGPGSSL